MDQISIKTPNPKCRLYCCLLEFVDWRNSQSCWYFTLLVNQRPSNLLTGSSAPAPPPLPCVNKYRGTCFHTVCNGGGWIGGLRQINTCRQVPLLVSFLKKLTFRVWCLYRYLVNGLCVHYRPSPQYAKPNRARALYCTVFSPNLWVRVTCEQDPACHVSSYQRCIRHDQTVPLLSTFLSSILYVPISCSSLL